MSATGVAAVTAAGLLAACADDEEGGPVADPATDVDDDVDDSVDDESDDEVTDAPDQEGAIVVGDLEGPIVITDPSQWPTSFNEAPEFAERVAAGELPPVEERIGEDPLVIQPLHEIGQYGGTWRRGFTGPGDRWNGTRVSGMDTLLTWHFEGQENVPNIAREWEFGDDGRSLTVYLRRGMHWSDGEPFTADDIMFWYEDMYGNDDLVPVKPADMFIGGEYGEIIKVDDYTLRFEFIEPYYLLLSRLSHGELAGIAYAGQNGNGLIAPAHYLRQFHADYADPDELEAAIEEAAVEDWIVLFKQKNNWVLNPDLPMVTPWIVDSPINSTTFTLKRNPYSIWVDTEGNQLPYIDEIVMTLAEDLNVLNLRAIAGEYDFQARHIDLATLPVLLENQDDGDYSVYLDTGGYGSDMAIIVNRSYQEDPVIADLLNSVDFRRALSLGIERDQLNETFWLGTGTPGSPAPAEINRFSPGPEYRTLWHESDPERANQMLDDLGLTEKDNEGFRMRPDGGGRLRLEVVIPGAAFMPYTQIAEMVAQQWSGIGIQLLINEVERSLWGVITDANEHQLTTWNNDASENVLVGPMGVFPYRSGDPAGPLYGTWFVTNGEQGLAPPEDFQEMMEMFTRARTAAEEEQTEIGRELWRRGVDQVNYIGLVGLSAAAQGVRVVKNNMGNIPARQYNSPMVRNPVVSCPPTFFFKS